jgi:hypothetical protein
MKLHLTPQYLQWRLEEDPITISLLLHLDSMLAQRHNQGSTLQQCTNKTLTTDPFGNTFEEDEFSPEVEVGVVAGLKCLQPRWDTDL